jgi:hypothetical protein
MSRRRPSPAANRLAGLDRPREASRTGRHRRFRVALALAGVIWAAPALACSVCGCGDPLLTSSDPAAINGTLRLQLDVEHLRIDAGTDGAPGYTDQLTQTSYRLNAAYRPIDALSLTATLPLVSKRIVTVGPTPPVTDSDLTGLGDVELGVRYAVWRSVQVGQQRSQEVALGVGTSLPTGAHDARMSDGSLVDPHGQLGTGGWGPFAGLYYRFEQGDWTGYANAGYRARTEASFLDGSKYKFGNAWLWSAHGQYLLAKRVALDLGVDGRSAVADRSTDPSGAVTSPVENTGGTVISLAPGAYVDAGAGLWLFGRGQVPVHKGLFGRQDVKPSFTVGVQYQVR